MKNGYVYNSVTMDYDQTPESLAAQEWADREYLARKRAEREQKRDESLRKLERSVQALRAEMRSKGPRSGNDTKEHYYLTYDSDGPSCVWPEWVSDSPEEDDGQPPIINLGDDEEFGRLCNEFDWEGA